MPAAIPNVWPGTCRPTGLQLFDSAFAKKFAFEILDPTKIIPEEDIPVRRAGELVLDRCVDNFFAETEQNHTEGAWSSCGTAAE